jgi:ABC-2 type transport system ATP-binding protein
MPSPTATPGPLAIQVEDLHKSFRIPAHRVDSLKERVVRPFSGRDYNELRALDGVSFEIGQGEFFGIVGRNGSGKSTLLKLLASIYRADSGKIRMAGLLAPFIELGVGFNPELSARENVVLNGVMIGLTPLEMRERLDAVLEFAELTDFVDLKLKNYSSGMLVRLAFSVMMQADADILLIDEVLAVGDAAFQQKCADAFQEMKAAGKTIVLVTHEMTTVEKYCHRAMLIDAGKIQYIGDPAEVGRRYLRLNFERDVEGTGTPTSGASEELRLLDSWLENSRGERETNVEHGEKVHLRFELEALKDLPGLALGYSLANADGVNVFQSGSHLRRADESTEIAAGERVQVGLELENLLVAGRYFVHLGVNLIAEKRVSLYVHNVADFVVYGGEETLGIVVLPNRVEASFDEASR